MGRNKKVDLIRATYTLLAENSPQDISIRSIVSAAGCTTGAVYRHFESVEHLMLVASVKFLEDYMVELNDILLQNSSPENQHRAMWQSFARQAFANVDVFEMMFWKASEDEFNDAIFTYYQEFPESWRKLSGFQVMVFFNSNLHERNRLTLARSVAGLGLKQADINTLSNIEICSFHGLLMEYQDCYRELGKAEEGFERFMQMLDYLHETVGSTLR